MNTPEALRQGYNTVRQHALEIAVFAAGLLATGDVVNQSDAHARTIKGSVISKGGDELPKRAIPARLQDEEIMNANPGENWLLFAGGYRQKIDNDYTRTGDLGTAQNSLDSITKYCIKYSTDTGKGDQFAVGRQSFNHTLGTGRMTVTSALYDDEMFTMYGANQAEWFDDCEDFTDRTILIEPIVKVGNRTKPAGKPVEIVYDDGNAFDKYVFEHKKKKANLEIDKKYRKSTKLGFRTKVEVNVKEPYEGQIVTPSANVQKKSRSWNTWFSKAKK